MFEEVKLVELDSKFKGQGRRMRGQSQGWHRAPEQGRKGVLDSLILFSQPHTFPGVNPSPDSEYRRNWGERKRNQIIETEEILWVCQYIHF